MIRGFKTFTVVSTIALLLTGCGPADRVQVQNGGFKVPTIEKGTKPVSEIGSEQDLYLHAFNELGWALRSADIAINQVQRSGKDGCITYRKGQRDSVIALVDFNCSSNLAIGDENLMHRRVFSGRETYTERSSESATVKMSSTFEQSLYTTETRKLVGRGTINRALTVTRPNIAEFPLASDARYNGSVATDSNRIGEYWSVSIDAVFASARSTGEILRKNSVLKFQYTPEHLRDEKANKLIVLELTATSEITFANPGGLCLRPVGTFSFELKRAGSTETGTATASANGLVLSTGGRETIPWGERCLER